MALMFTCVIIFSFHLSIWLISVQIEFCVDEWSTGIHIKNRFTEEEVAASYRVHLTDVNTWDQLAPTVTQRIRQSYYTKSR